MKANQPKFDVSFKIVFLGDSGVGKTSILYIPLFERIIFL
jgi:GTPase SAR1 family protein